MPLLEVQDAVSRVLGLGLAKDQLSLAFRRAIEGEHLHVVRDGSILRDRLRRHHLTEEHVWAAIRGSGLVDPRQVEDAYTWR